jgi:arginine/ornithine transport system permease protein
VDFSVIWENIGLYLDGLVTTVELVVAALILGLLMSVPLAIIQSSRNPLVRFPVFCFSYFFRGTPLLVQLFLIYYGAGQFVTVQESFLWPVLREAYWCALIAFTLNTAAYSTEIFRGAIVAAPLGEIEAARACGMSRALAMRRIILPGAFRRALPAYGNEVIFMLHGSAIASVITIVDLTGAARMINSRYYTPYESFLTVAAFYLALTFLIVAGFRVLERKWFAHLRPRENK